METNKLKKLIGNDCLVIDPRSKKKVYENATITEVNVNIRKGYGTDELCEHLSYTVKLHKLTVRKKGFFREYHRSFDVSGDRIIIT